MPSMSVLECVLTLMNNSWSMMNDRFWGVLEQTDAWDVWEPSFYAGTIGDVTTAEVKAYLRSDENGKQIFKGRTGGAKKGTASRTRWV